MPSNSAGISEELAIRPDIADCQAHGPGVPTGNSWCYRNCVQCNRGIKTYRLLGISIASRQSDGRQLLELSTNSSPELPVLAFGARLHGHIHSNRHFSASFQFLREHIRVNIPSVITLAQSNLLPVPIYNRNIPIGDSGSLYIIWYQFSRFRCSFCFVLPAVLSWFFCEVLRKKGWIGENDLKLDL